MFFFDVVDVGNYVLLGQLLGAEVVVIGKNIAHLGCIVADGHGRIGLCLQKGRKL